MAHALRLEGLGLGRLRQSRDGFLHGSVYGGLQGSDIYVLAVFRNRQRLERLSDQLADDVADALRLEGPGLGRLRQSGDRLLHGGLDRRLQGDRVELLWLRQTGDRRLDLVHDQVGDHVTEILGREARAVRGLRDVLQHLCRDVGLDLRCVGVLADDGAHVLGAAVTEGQHQTAGAIDYGILHGDGGKPRVDGFLQCIETRQQGRVRSEQFCVLLAERRDLLLEHRADRLSELDGIELHAPNASLAAARATSASSLSLLASGSSGSSGSSDGSGFGAVANGSSLASRFARAARP